MADTESESNGHANGNTGAGAGEGVGKVAAEYSDGVLLLPDDGPVATAFDAELADLRKPENLR